MAVTPKLNFTRVSISDALSAENTRSIFGARIFFLLSVIAIQSVYLAIWGLLRAKNALAMTQTVSLDLARLSNRDTIYA
jgi:hypothetical protein